MSRALAGIVESSDDAIIVKTLDGTITAWNPGAERMYGYTPAEAIGRNMSMIANPAGAIELADILTRIGHRERVDHHETERVGKDGTVVDVSVTISPVLDDHGTIIGASVVARDITGRKVADAARRTLAAIVESSHDAIISKTLEGTITAWNLGAEHMYGYTATEAIGHNVSMLTNPADALELADILTRIRRGERVDHHETERFRKDGTVVDVSVTISPVLDDHGTVIGASAVARDITAKNRIDADRRALVEQSHQAQRLQSLGQLAGGIAHDFNNLLGVISNYTEFVAEVTTDNASAQTDIAQIRTAAQRAAGLTHQLLIFARGEDVQAEVLDVNTIIGEVQALLVRTIGENIEFVTVASPTPLMINADPGQIQQVLMNLALNARDAMPDGGTLVVQATLAELDGDQLELHPALTSGKYARILVSDTGVGMSPDVVAHIFEPFYTTKPRGQGTGLGMATVYGIVSEAGGSVDVYSEFNLGTTIRVYLPVADVSAVAAAVSAAAPPQLAHGETILVAEDEEAIRHLVKRILDRHGYTVVLADNGSHALRLDREHHWDLLLTDVVMPEMSGRDLANVMRQRHPHRPVLYMSGYTDGQLGSQRVLDPGVDLIQKPFTAAELLARIHDVLIHALAPIAADQS